MIRHVPVREGYITGRNGFRVIKEVEISTYDNSVYIGGISKARGRSINGGITVDKTAARMLADKLLEMLEGVDTEI